MEYQIVSHDDVSKTIVVSCKGYNLTVSYPQDIETFDQFTNEQLDLIISGIISPYNDMPEYTEPEVSTDTTHGDWR